MLKQYEKIVARPFLQVTRSPRFLIRPITQLFHTIAKITCQITTTNILFQFMNCIFCVIDVDHREGSGPDDMAQFKIFHEENINCYKSKVLEKGQCN